MLADRQLAFFHLASASISSAGIYNKSAMCIALCLVTSQPSHDKGIANLGTKSTVNGLLHYRADEKPFLKDSRS
jgi:hypothetical protein